MVLIKKKKHSSDCQKLNLSTVTWGSEKISFFCKKKKKKSNRVWDIVFQDKGTFEIENSWLLHILCTQKSNLNGVELYGELTKFKLKINRKNSFYKLCRYVMKTYIKPFLSKVFSFQNIL